MKFYRTFLLSAFFVIYMCQMSYAQVTTKDGRPLSFYADHNTPYHTVGDLIQHGDGNCRAWTQLFLETLKVHGIDTSGTFVKIGFWDPQNPKHAAKSLLVKEWTFRGNGISGSAEWPYINIFKRTANIEDVKHHRNLIYEEVSPGTAMNGQGGTTPPRYFGNHQFARINGKYYDPSYGTESDDDRDFMMSGYMWMVELPINEAAFGRDLDGNGKIETVTLPCVLYRKHQKNWAPHEITNY